MENILQLASEILPSILSILACIIAFCKGNRAVPLTSDQIEEKAEAKKQKLITKLNKKNKIKPSEASIQGISTTDKAIYQQNAQNVSNGLNKDEFLKNLKVGGDTNGNETC